MHADLTSAVASIPSGAYALGVSGGADSVALLHLLRHHRLDLNLHVVHLDHETRGAASAGDAEFVRTLASRWNLPHTIVRRGEIEPSLEELPANPSARYRALRHHVFRQVTSAHRLRAVILAHHADDQAETVLQRLLRGTHALNLGGMAERSNVNGLLILRPLLRLPGSSLRDYLKTNGQPWREDASNASMGYLRNRLRSFLAARPGLADALTDVHEHVREVRTWVDEHAPRLPERFPARALTGQPSMLVQAAARRWLIDRGVPTDELAASVTAQLVRMATDAASPPRWHFPGGIMVRRARGVVSAGDQAAPVPAAPGRNCG